MISLKNILRLHAEWILTAIGLVLVAVIAWFLIWGVTTLAQHLGASLSTPKAPYAGETFDLDSASRLNFRGL